MFLSLSPIRFERTPTYPRLNPRVTRRASAVLRQSRPGCPSRGSPETWRWALPLRGALWRTEPWRRWSHSWITWWDRVHTRRGCTHSGRRHTRGESLRLLIPDLRLLFRPEQILDLAEDASLLSWRGRRGGAEPRRRVRGVLRGPRVVTGRASADLRWGVECAGRGAWTAVGSVGRRESLCHWRGVLGSVASVGRKW